MLPARTPDDRFSGNGGLSLRRVSAIKRVLNFQARYNDSEPEDEWFGKRVYVLPGAKVAAGANGALAVEDVYMDNPMGFHVRDGGSALADDVWKKYDQRQKIFNYCPELAMIMDMKLERERCEGDNREGNIPRTVNAEEMEKAEKTKGKQVKQEVKQDDQAMKERHKRQESQNGHGDDEGDPPAFATEHSWKTGPGDDRL